MFGILLFCLKHSYSETSNSYVPNYDFPFATRQDGNASIYSSCFIDIKLTTPGNGGAIFYNGSKQLTVNFAGFFFCYVVDGDGGAIYGFAPDIQFYGTCAYNCYANKEKGTSIGQFASLTGKKPGLIVVFHKSTIFGCPGGGLQSFHSTNYLYSSPVYFANDPSTTPSNEIYSSLQYDHSNATHSYINDGSGSVLLKNSLLPHVQYCYITDNEMVSEDPLHGFIDISQCNKLSINGVILKNNVGKGNSLFVLDEIHIGGTFELSDFQFLYLQNNTYEFFIMFVNGGQVKLEHLFYGGSDPVTKYVALISNSSNAVLYGNNFSKSSMKINYESVTLDCDNVYFHFTKSVSPSQSISPSKSLSPSKSTLSPSQSISPSKSISPSISPVQTATPLPPPPTNEPTYSPSPVPTISTASPSQSLSPSPSLSVSQSTLSVSQSPTPSKSISPSRSPSRSLPPIIIISPSLITASKTFLATQQFVPVPPPGDQANSGSLSSWKISLIVLAPILLALIAFLLWYLYRRRKLAEKGSDGAASAEGAETLDPPNSTISQENPLFKADQDLNNAGFDED